MERAEDRARDLWARASDWGCRRGSVSARLANRAGSSRRSSTSASGGGSSAGSSRGDGGSLASGNVSSQ